MERPVSIIMTLRGCRGIVFVVATMSPVGDGMARVGAMDFAGVCTLISCF